MFKRMSKKDLFSKLVLSLVIVCFVISSVPASGYANLTKADKLRPKGAEGRSALSDVARELKRISGASEQGDTAVEIASRLNLKTADVFNFQEGEQKIAEPVLTPLQEFVEEINSVSSSSKIGFTYKDNPRDRTAQIGLLLQEINKELAQPGTGNLPKIVLMSDYHGGIERFAALLSDALSRFTGFKGKLDPKVSIEKQLNAQGLSLKTMKGAIYLTGDLLDRGKSGLACFNIAKELLETAPDKVFYVSGNHDLWAFLNLSGFHLPWNKGFKFYGDTEAEKLIAEKQVSNPELFNGKFGKTWWSTSLVVYNADQEEFQKKALDGKAADIRKKFIESYQKYSADKKWDSAQLDAMENFIGHFARIDVPDPYVGLNGLGKTSTVWWKSLQQQLIKGREARSSLGADADEISVWDEAITLAEVIVPQVEARLKTALEQGKWDYRIFESINNQAYLSLEWWAKDWSSHKDWGEAVIKELNAMIKDLSNTDPFIVEDRGEFKGQEITEANYMRSHKLQDLAALYKNNFNLDLRSPYSDIVTHGLLPIENDDIVITYKNKIYKGEAIFEVLKLISTEIKETKDLRSAWEVLNLVNSWYADATTIAKPKNEKDLLKKIAPVLSKLGVRIWAKGHNPVNKLKVPVISQDSKDSRFAIVQLDLGMAPKFGGAGGYVILGPDGIGLRGFETDKIDENIKEFPDTIIPGKKPEDNPTIIKNPGMLAKEYLENIKAALSEEFVRLQPSKKVIPSLAQQVREQFLKDLAGIIEITPREVKVLDRELFLQKGLDILANAAALSKNPDVKVAAKRALLEVAPLFGIKLASDHEFYMAKQQGKWKNITVPAVNGRSTVYLSLKPLYRVAKEDNVGVVKTEVARSEQRYSDQDSSEIVAISVAAAIKEGWTGLLFVQQDHNQVNKDKWLKGGADRQKEIDARNTLFREGLLAGQYNIDLDPSTLVDEIALEEIIKTEGELVNQYLQKHPDLLTALEGDKKAEGSLRRRLVDEIEIGDVEDKDFLALPDVAAKIKLLKEELYPKMHKVSIEVTLSDIRTIRKLEKEFGLTKPGSIGIEERHIDNPRHKDFPSTVLGSITLSQSILKVTQAEGLVAHSKISLQTGAMHGVGGTVDFGIYERHVKHADKIGVSVFVQHGASTLEKQDFDKMRDGDVGEVHLATEYQKIVFAIIAQEYPELAEKMAKWLEELMAKDPSYAKKFKTLWDAAFAQPGKDKKTVIAEILGDSSNMPKELKGKLKDLVKELSAPFKNELWNLPENVRQKIDKALYDEFKLIFGKLGVVNTRELIESIMPYEAYPVHLAPRPAGVDAVFGQTVVQEALAPTVTVRNKAIIIDSSLVHAVGATEILKAISNLDNPYVVAFYGAGAEAVKILSEAGVNIITADDAMQVLARLRDEMGIAPAKIRFVTTVFNEKIQQAGINQKVISSLDAVSVLIGITKAITELNDSPEAGNIFRKLYTELFKKGVIASDKDSAAILDMATKGVEIVKIDSRVAPVEDSVEKSRKEILTQLGV